MSIVAFRQDLIGRENELRQALGEIEGGLLQLDEIELKSIEKSLDSVHQSLQNLENQQPRLSSLQVEIQQLLRSCTADETQLLTKKSKELADALKVRHKCFIGSTVWKDVD